MTGPVQSGPELGTNGAEAFYQTVKSMHRGILLSDLFSNMRAAKEYTCQTLSACIHVVLAGLPFTQSFLYGSSS